MIIETERLILRPTKIEDTDDFISYNQDELFYRFLHIDKPTAETTKKMVEKCIADNSSADIEKYHFILTLKGSDRAMGDIHIRMSDEKSKVANTGYGLNPIYWGKGYMSEALMAIIDFGFNQLKVHRIFATAHPENSGSISVMEKCGMQYEGLHRGEMLVRGNYEDRAYYAILNSDPR